MERYDKRSIIRLRITLTDAIAEYPHRIAAPIVSLQ